MDSVQSEDPIHPPPTAIVSSKHQLNMKGAVAPSVYLLRLNINHRLFVKKDTSENERRWDVEGEYEQFFPVQYNS